MTKGNEDERRWRETLQTFGTPQMSQSLEIGLSVLRAFSVKRPTLGIADIADELKMSRSTTHRYVVTLQACRLLEQGARRKYRLGSAARNVGMSMLYATGLPALADPFLEDLRDQLGYTVSLAILDHDSILYAARAYSHRKGQYAADEGRRIGSRAPAHLTAPGKVLVAGLPEDELRMWMDTTILSPGERDAVAAKRRFRAELDQVGENGYAVNNREPTAKTIAVAVPIHQEGNVNVALAVAAYAATIDATTVVHASLDALRHTADVLARHIQYDPRAKW